MFCVVDQRGSWQAIIYIIMNVCVEYFVNEMGSGYRVDDLTKVYCCKKSSETGFAALRTSRIICIMCEVSVCRLVRSVAV